MTKTVGLTNGIAILFYTLQSVYTGTTHTSKTCYGQYGLQCTRHVLSCSSNQKIAIYDAYYTDNTECRTGISSCSVNPDSVTERGYHRFNNAELVSLYDNCSTETQCVYPAPRRGAALAFSVVKYQCIKGVARRDMSETDSLNISGGVAVGLSQVSLTHGDKRIPSSTPQTNTCLCTFKSNVTATSISVYTLDARSGRGTSERCLSKLSVLPGDVITTNNCSTLFIPFERLNVTAELPVSLYFSDIMRPPSALVWLLINASDPFNVKCETETVTSTVGFNTGSTGGRSPVSTSSQFPAGVFVGGVAVGVVIVILIGLAVYVFVVRRRYDLTVKKQGDAPASIEHPTYSGLSAGADVNNCDIIEQTSKFKGETAHEVAATQDYQNL
ncbi:uncharacterized protein LOC124139990 [Haliotis rufescens]|uniref:uncharacterized protein LOC124139990 n=1 Tax=Haliotis rufescens TaxID=6454 RepID=UPI00201F34D0|nr:uncharacterized protein LOC124139990 [Haliotis rufescens]